MTNKHALCYKRRLYISGTPVHIICTATAIKGPAVPALVTLAIATITTNDDDVAYMSADQSVRPMA